MKLPQNELAKLKKILRLAESTNEAEALNAANRATELLARYNLTMGDLDLVEQDVAEELFSEFRTAQKSKWRRILLDFVARATDCQAISVRVGRPGVWRYQLGLIGSEAGRQVCSQLFGYLEETIERLAHEAVAERKAIGVYIAPSYRQNFSEGAAVRLAARLDAETKRRQAEGMIFEDGTITDAGAIVHVHQSAMEAIDRFCENQGITDAPSVRFDVNRDGFAQGHQAADAIGLSPQLQEAM